MLKTRCRPASQRGWWAGRDAAAAEYKAAFIGYRFAGLFRCLGGLLSMTWKIKSNSIPYVRLNQNSNVFWGICTGVSAKVWMYSPRVQVPQAKRRSREWVTNENLSHNGRLNSLGVVLYRDCASRPPFNHRSLFPAVEEKKRGKKKNKKAWGRCGERMAGI